MMERVDDHVDLLADQGLGAREASQSGPKKVCKSNMLINAYYKLTLVEQRVLLLILADLNPFEPVPESLRLNAHDYAETYGTSLKRAYQALQDAAAHLHERTLEIEGQVIHWLAGPVEYCTGEAEIVLGFSAEIEPHIHHFTRNFTNYELQRVSSLQSTHAIRLYELCVSWKRNGTLHITVEQFKRRMGLEGRYTKYRDLKWDVIEPAIKELRNKSGLVIRYDVKKRGRRVDSFTFTFKEKSLPGSNLVRFPGEGSYPGSRRCPS